jgi:hypothetical protein
MAVNPIDLALNIAEHQGSIHDRGPRKTEGHLEGAYLTVVDGLESRVGQSIPQVVSMLIEARCHCLLFPIGRVIDSIRPCAPEISPG